MAIQESEARLRRRLPRRLRRLAMTAGGETPGRASAREGIAAAAMPSRNDGGGETPGHASAREEIATAAAPPRNDSL